MSKKMGRPPATNPKDVNIKIRVESATNAKLVAYAEKHNISRTEVIRRGIKLVLDSEK